jgi:tetrahydromethanopterin S-methyltransferase subunit C
MLIAVIGAVAIVRGFRVHGGLRILLLMAAGLVCIFTGAYLGNRLPSHNVEVMIALLGSCLMIASHRLNHTFCKRCTTCT